MCENLSCLFDPDVIFFVAYILQRHMLTHSCVNLFPHTIKTSTMLMIHDEIFPCFARRWNSMGIRHGRWPMNLNVTLNYRKQIFNQQQHGMMETFFWWLWEKYQWVAAFLAFHRVLLERKINAWSVNLNIHGQ